MAFITPHELYCYRVMPFGLKNVEATYQKLMTKIFKPLIGHIVEVYIDDIVVKTYNMKLNPAKCTFGVSASKFLGFMVTQRGIEVNQDQIKDVMETFPPSRLAALGRFIARFTDKLKFFFLTLKGASLTGWTSDYEQAFGEIKCYLT
ncbi:hypothetical protein AAG906_023402 [Vitis piasezkii]